MNSEKKLSYDKISSKTNLNSTPRKIKENHVFSSKN
jgi:hypothetical protein